jgi:NAD(P) transhydrogenase
MRPSLALVQDGGKVVVPEESTYELVAIGSGPAGRRAAVQAAALGKRVALIEKGHSLGGVCTNAGTVPSKTLRAAIVELTGRAAGAYGSAARVPHDITIDDLLWRTRQVIDHDRDAVADELRRSHVDVIEGTATFRDGHTIDVETAAGTLALRAERIVVAVGTVPARPAGIDFDDRTVLDSDCILQLAHLPKELIVVGGGVIGLEYASMAGALGVPVTVIEQRERVLGFLDEEIGEALLYHLRGIGLNFRLGDAVRRIQRVAGGEAITFLRSGKRLSSDVVVFAAGRVGATATLNLEAAGLEADDRGRIRVGADYRTAQSHIFAVGDVIGFPKLAASAMEQGRLAALIAFDQPVADLQAPLPYAIHTIPEISFIGRNERQLAAACVPYVAGVARYRDLPRAEIAGERSGLLKLLVHAENRRLLGVHIFGSCATELLHVGQTVMAAGLPVDYLAEAVFNVPTFSDAYKVAAVEAVGRLNALGAPSASAAA